MTDSAGSNGLMRGFRVRFYPTLRQRRTLARAFGVGRFVWNWALALEQESYRKDKTRLGLSELSRALTALRVEKPWLKEINRQLQTQSLRDLERAFQNFFAQRARYPRFKSRRGQQSARLCLDARHAKLGREWSERRPQLPGLGRCRVADSYDPWPELPKMITVSRDTCGDYWLSFATPVPLKPCAPDRILGVDVGITDLAVTSEGWKSGQLKISKQQAARLKRYQRQVSRRQRGSRRRSKAKRRLSALHRKSANARKDFIHKTSDHIAQSAHVVVLETLNVQGMLKNHPIARALSNASISELHRQIDYKVTQRGGTVIRVDRWEPTSKRCSGCGRLNEPMDLSVRQWQCAGCQTIHDRDVNAARNLAAIGAGSAEYKRGDWRGTGSAVAEAVLQVEPRIDAADWRRMDRR